MTKIALASVFGMVALFGAAETASAQIYVEDRRVVLQDAVNRGYQQGFQEGQLDRGYGRRMSYADSNIYRQATFGFRYGSNWRGRYQRAFQRGYERGYEDGYYSRYRYGRRTNTGLQVVGSLINSIIRSID